MKTFFSQGLRRLIAQRLGVGDELNLLDRRTRQLAFTFGFSIIGGTTLAAYGIVYLVLGNPAHALVDFFFTLFSGLNVLILRRTKNLLAATGAIIALMIALATILLLSGGLGGTGFLWL